MGMMPELVESQEKFLKMFKKSPEPIIKQKFGSSSKKPRKERKAVVSPSKTKRETEKSAKTFRRAGDLMGKKKKATAVYADEVKKLKRSISKKK